jgi:hypothetical protein
MNKIFYFIIIFIQILSTIWIVLTIEKHSIHPIYARKIENVNYNCAPWDSC